MGNLKANSRTCTYIFLFKKITGVCVIGLGDKLTVILTIAVVEATDTFLTKKAIILE